MKKMFTLITLFVVVLVSSCSYDDTYVVKSIKDLQNRVSELEQLQNASDRGLLVESVTEIEGGYIVKFSDGSEIILYHGKDGADGKDGVDGEDGADGKDGVDGADGKDGVDGVDGKDGVDGTSILEDIVITDEMVTFYLVDGSSFTFYFSGKQEPIGITFDIQSGVACKAGTSLEFGYAITGGYTDAEVECFGNGGWSADVTVASSTSGTIKVVAPKDGGSGKVVVLVVSATGGSSMKSIRFDEGVIEDIVNLYEVGWEANTVEVEFRTNLEYDVRIPSEAQSWISVIDTRATMRDAAITLAIAENPAGNPDRSAMIELTSNTGDVISSFEISQKVQLVEELIVFADDNVKTVCVQKFDKNGDGEISMSEAAEVTTLGKKFFGDYSTNVTSFDELKYFVNLNSISTLAFNGCKNLSSVTLPDSVTTIGENAFDNCSSLTSVTIPESVTTIGKYAFFYCSSLTSIIIPDSVTSIGNYAFCQCHSLKNVNLGNSLVTIGNSAFAYCYDLDSIYIPDSVKTIGEAAFTNCDSLTSVTIGDGVTTIGNTAFYYCRKLASLIIGESVTTIGNSAFYYCESLIDIIIPDSVTSIGYSTFKYCYGLISVTIGKGVTMIGDYAFEECYNLTTVYISDLAAWCNIKFNRSYKTNPLYYAHNLYLNNELVRTITIPDNVTKIGDYVFAECTNLTSVTIPDSVTAIGNATFEKCYNLVNVDIGAGVTTIGSSAFANCSSLKSVTIPDSVTLIGGQAFSRCSSLMEVTIGAGVTTIDSQAFDYCTNLKSVYISDVAAWCSISFANESANPLYYNKANLYLNNELVVDLVVPDSVTAIGSNVFISYANLTSVTIGDGVTTIGENAFSGCSNLTSVTIPDSVTSIENYAFSGCTSLASVTIPDSVTSIGERAFNGCKGLTSVNIPGSVTSIGESAFIGCKSLTSVNIPGSVTTIDNWIFGSCVGLTELTIGEGVTSMNYAAFSGCSNLTSVTIPSSVTFIGCYVFENCSNLTSVYCKAITPPATEAKSWTDWVAFNNNAADRKIYVPMESVEAYKVAAGWSDYVDDIVGYNF